MSRLLLSFILLIAVSAARASQNEIKGFHYQNCDASKCVEVTAPRAWISQFSGGFVTDGDTVVRVTDGKDSKEFKCSEATLQNKTQTISFASGTGATFVSLKDFTIKSYGGTQ